MPSREGLERKWTSLGDERSGVVFDMERFSSERFYVLQDEGGFACGPCGVRVLGIFDDAADALACLRWHSIPRLLAAETRDRWTLLAEYERLFSPRLSVAPFAALLDALERALGAERATREHLDAVQQLADESFRRTNPSLGIVYWGSFDQILCWSVAHLLDEEAGAEDERPAVLALEQILSAGTFDVGDPAHRELALAVLWEVQSL